MTLEEHKQQTAIVDSLFYISAAAVTILNRKLELMFRRHRLYFTSKDKDNFNKFIKSYEGVNKWGDEILEHSMKCCTTDGSNDPIKVDRAINVDANDLIQLWIDVINADYVDPDAVMKIKAYARNISKGKNRINDEVREYFNSKDRFK